MKKYKTEQFNIDDPTQNISIEITTEHKSVGELREKAIKALLSGTNKKYDFADSGPNGLDRFVEEVLLAAVDVLGYEMYYWEFVDDSEKKMNGDNLEVSKKARVEFLEMIVQNMKDNL